MHDPLLNKLGGLKQIAQLKIVNILKKIPGKKDFIIDKTLIKSLERVLGVSVLRANGVEGIYKLEESNVPLNNTQRVFFIASNLITLKHVCNKIHFERTQENDGNSYHIIFLGRPLASMTKLLEEEGIYGTVVLYYYDWEFIVLDNKVLSLENHSVMKDLFIEGDFTCLPSMARALWTFTMIFGKPLVTVTVGKYSKLVNEMLNTFHSELGKPDRPDCDVPYLIIFDRNVDYASTLLTGVTYTSLLDEVYGVNSGFVEVKTDKTDKKSSCLLNSSDEIYCNIKNRHFSNIFPYLRMKTKELTDQYKSKLSTIEDMKKYVTQHLQSATTLKKSVAYHISACEGIQNTLGHRYENLLLAEQNMVEGRAKRDCITYIEEHLAMDLTDKYSILRMIALLSLAHDGLLPDEISSLKQQFLHQFGYQLLPIFYNLEKLELFNEQQGLLSSDVKGVYIANKVVQAVTLPTRRSNFYSFAQKMKLICETDEEFDVNSPKSLSYVFSGTYTPLIPQIIKMILKKEITVNDLVKLLPNCCVDVKSTEKMNNIFLVFVVGGVTYSEIAAFQLVEILAHCEIIVAGSTITSGNKIMKACFPSECTL